MGYSPLPWEYKKAVIQVLVELNGVVHSAMPPYYIAVSMSITDEDCFR